MMQRKHLVIGGAVLGIVLVGSQILGGNDRNDSGSSKAPEGPNVPAAPSGHPTTTGQSASTNVRPESDAPTGDTHPDKWLDTIGPDAEMFTRVAMWNLGRNLALLALAEAQQISGFDEIRRETESLCRVIGQPMPGLRDRLGSPIGEGSDSVRMAKAVNYVLEVAPAALAGPISERYGRQAVAAFELGLKSTVTSPLVGDPDLQRSMATIIERNGRDSGMAPQTWEPLIRTLRSPDAAEQYRHVLTRTQSQTTRYMNRLGG